MKKVFVSTSSFARDDRKPLELLEESGFSVALNPLGRKLEEGEIARFLQEVSYLIAGTESLSRRVLESAKQLRIISRCGVGLDNVDLAAAKQLGIEVFTAPTGPTIAVAELTVGLMLDVLRQTSQMDRQVRAGNWNKLTGFLLKDKNVGIIGFGRIGRQVAKLLRGFGAQPAYCDIMEVKTDAPCLRLSLDELLAWANIVTLHCSGAESGKPVIGARQLKTMQPGSWLINTARGGLVDENAIFESLQSRHLRGAALDVFGQEPYTGRLCQLDNLVLTPHIGSYARESRRQMEIEAAMNVINHAAGDD